MDEPLDQDTDSAPGHGPERTVGHFRLLRSLGRGGFGEVFLGEDPSGRQAAVKVLHASWAGDTEMRRRFATEVDQARRVSGFCIASILDADPEADEPWIATEYIDGPTLQTAVDMEGPRTEADLHRLAVSTATALAAIHSAGVVHRDLKPENIMLAADGPRVIDFGIARAVESTSVTASGVIGTIGYMAPEQLEGMRLTPAVDLFSWGAVMVFAATGREAFPGPTQAARIARILGGEPDVEGLDGPLSEVVLACLDKNPADRPDAATLLQQLVTLPAEDAAPAGPVGGGAAPTTVEPSADNDRTAVTPSPDAATSLGVDRTRLETSAPEQVAGTRVAPPAKADPTRAYTRVADPEDRAAAHQVPPAESPAPSTPGDARTSGPPGTPAGSGNWVHRDGVPPYHFLGVRHEDPGTLAESMQQNWNEALRVFSDPGERGALSAWLTDDIGDTLVDRSLFRRKVTDANLALATFVAQVRPDLPPVFRGRTVTVEALTEQFSDPAPVLTGAPQANELALLARPVVLRTMGRHHSDRLGELQRLADQLETAERAGIDFQQQLAGGLNGWSDVRSGVNPALVLTFLLGPQTPPRPVSDDAGVREWVDILWTKVATAAQPAAAGYAAAVHRCLPTLATLAHQRREWEGRYAAVSTEHESLMNAVRRQSYLERGKMISKWCLLGLIGNFIADVAGSDFFMLVTGVAFFAGVIGVIVIGPTLRLVYGTPARRAERYMELRSRTEHLRQLQGGVDRIQHDLDTARRLTSG